MKLLKGIYFQVPSSVLWKLAVGGLGVGPVGFRAFSVSIAEWMHFALFWIILPTTNLKVYTLGGL